MIVCYLFVRAALCREAGVACPIRKAPEMGKRGDNSPAAVNDEFKFIVLVETTFHNQTETWITECVGTVVRGNQVVTAGHCVQPEPQDNANVSEVNVFFLHRSHADKCVCEKTRVTAFLNYDQLSYNGPAHFDFGLLYISDAVEPAGKLPLCNESAGEDASSGPLFFLSFSTDELKIDSLLLTRVPLTFVKQDQKLLTLKLRDKGIACYGDSGSPVVLQTPARHLCLIAVQAKIVNAWKEDGIKKSRLTKAPIMKDHPAIMKMIQDDRKPNSVEKHEWPKRYGLHFREMSPSLGEGSQQTEPFLPELDETPKSTGCFRALWNFCNRGK